MKDAAAKTLLLLIGWWLIAYTIRLWTQQAVLVADGMEQYNMIAYVYLSIIGIYLLALAVVESIVPNNRRSLLVLWLALIITSHLYLSDSPELRIYIWDIVKLIWVFLVITWPTKFFISKKYQEKKFEQEVEIIEV